MVSYNPAILASCISHMPQGFCSYCSPSSITFSSFFAGNTHTFSLNMNSGVFVFHIVTVPQRPLILYNMPERWSAHLGHSNHLGSWRIWLPVNLCLFYYCAAFIGMSLTPHLNFCFNYLKLVHIFGRNFRKLGRVLPSQNNHC